ncbi:HAMP domain-containing histidine kinase [Bacillaceae bacterium Marseille-Q3522]|nr:HAMP domain-containing histidine kinase [Bacillaceae bacterium Marseille-Q3522]
MIGLVVIGIISAMWIRHTTIENRLNTTRLLAESLADRFSQGANRQPGAKVDVAGLLQVRENLNYLGVTPFIYIVENNGNILSVNRIREPLFHQFIPPEYLDNEQEVQKIRTDQEYYLVKEPVEVNDVRLGWVVIAASENELTQVNQEYSQLTIMLIGLALLGWAAIYFLSKRLARPIKNVAEAAKQVQEGKYDVDLSGNYKEEELYELVQSFKDMTKRLQQLETLRSELLAGVTHELKTPVTSISGLLQALKDDVVTGEEAKEFITISLKEANRMQKMVADLLAFNSFSANTLPLNKAKYEINQLITDITHQWRTVQKDAPLDFQVNLLEKSCFIRVDAMRLQQIMENLLNNAKQAIAEHGKIAVSLNFHKEKRQVEIEIEDNGVGITKEEQPFIFERFYRGENKKYQVRGLGIGLPFSKMLANSLEGDLCLKESSPGKTIFQITLPEMLD